MGKIVVGAIMLTMLAFIGTDLIGNSTLLGGGKEPDIAEIAGTSISNKQFQAKVDELSYYFALNAGRNPIQEETEQIRSQAWNALILEHAYQPQFEELGITVTDAELVDMVQGKNISPQIKQFFSDPNTGQFQKSNVTNFLAGLAQAPPQQQNSWMVFEQSLIPSRTIQKYSTLLEKTNYVTKHEAKEQYVSQEGDVSIEYVYVPYLSLPDSLVDISDSDLKTFLNENEEEYKREEYRNLKFVAFDIIPSSYDSTIVSEEVNELFEELRNSTDDSTYVSINSDDPLSYLTYYENNLPDTLAGKLIGYTTKPVIVNGAYEFYKLSAIDTVDADSMIYRVAKLKKEFFVSDETINEVYRQADLFAASVENLEEFEKQAKEQGLKVQSATKVGKNSTRVGTLGDARSIVLWLYNEGKVGAVSDVKEIGDQYIVAAMTSRQEEGLANLDEVRNQVERKVRNEKKAEIILEKLNSIEADDLKEVADSYGKGAKVGEANFKLNTNSVSGVGYAPEAIGIAKVLNEQEKTKAFKLQDGVIMMKLVSKDLPEDTDGYDSYIASLQAQRMGSRTVVADFPLTFFRMIIPRSLDETVKEHAEIEDMRYKFF